MITAILLLATALFIAVQALGSNWSNVLSTTRNDLVFANRNRAYGAYVLRREHHRVMLIAFLITLGTLGAGLALPLLMGSAPIEALPVPRIEVEVDLGTIHDPAIPKVQPPAAPAPRPKRTEFSAIPVAVDSMVKAPVDTTAHPVDPGPKGPEGPGPKDPGPAPGGGGGPDPGTIIEGWAADVSPEYPGGLPGLYADLQRLVRYPDIDVDAQRQGKVLVGFVVAEDGSVMDIKVMKGVSPTLDAEAVRVVGKLKKWKPGQFKGHDVKVRFNLPISFRLAKQ